VSYPNAAERGKAKRGSVSVRAAPNKALHLTAYSVRSCLAPAFGSRWAPAFSRTLRVRENAAA